ncbi:MAG: CDP-diacylglycerol--glycerol-3-phosphate 3-phosphatidyltransferase [Candidatus Omnitrophota bacterium]|nr:CDP-diacylglycerol--glycerol-3-phosphate 3-phosphatidyltransferase [Candidatus Omnitrophota bacterium]
MNLPNYITLVRVLLVPWFFIALVSYTPGEEFYRWTAFWIFAVAALTDALDGFLARILNKQTKLGRFLDPLADKLLLLAGFVGLVYVEALMYRPPLWVTVSIVFRDFFIVAGILIIYLLTGNIRIQPNMLGRVTTVFQMGTLILILLQLRWAVPMCYATAMLTIVSMLAYAARELRALADAT